MNTITRYTSEGKQTYTVSESYSYRPIMVILVLLALLVAIAITSIVVHAQPIEDGTGITGHMWIDKNDRPVLLCIAVDWEGYGSVTGDTMRPCTDDTVQSTVSQSNKRNNDKPYVSTNNDNTPVTIAPVPVQEHPTKVKSNNGNHYGNDRPDNNAHDCKNKHDVACQ